MENQKFTFNCPHCGQPLEAETDGIGLERSSICWGKIFFPQPCINSNSSNTFWGKIISGRMVGIVALASVVAIAIPVASAYSYAPIGNTDYYSVWTPDPGARSNNRVDTEKKDSSRVIETEPPTQPETSQQSGKIPKLYRFDYGETTYTAMEIVGSGYYCILSARENSTPFHWSEWELEQIFQKDPRYCAKRPIFQESGWHFQKAPDRFEYKGRTHNMVAIPETDYYSVWVNGGTPYSWSKDRLDMAKRDPSYRVIETKPHTQPETSQQVAIATSVTSTQSSSAYPSGSVLQKFSYKGKIYNMTAIPGTEDYCVWTEGKHGQPFSWSRERLNMTKREDPTFRVIETEPPNRSETSQQSGKVPKLYRFDYKGVPYNAMEIIGSGYYCIIPAKENPIPFYWSERKLEEIFQNDSRYCEKQPIFQEAEWLYQMSKDREIAQLTKKFPKRFKFGEETFTAHEIPDSCYVCVCPDEGEPFIWTTMQMAKTENKSIYRPMLPVQSETAQQPAKSPERFKYDGNTYNAYEVPGTDYYCVWTEDGKPMVWPKSKMAQTKRDSSYSAGEIRKEMVKR